MNEPTPKLDYEPPANRSREPLPPPVIAALVILVLFTLLIALVVILSWFDGRYGR